VISKKGKYNSVISKEKEHQKMAKRETTTEVIVAEPASAPAFSPKLSAALTRGRNALAARSSHRNAIEETMHSLLLAEQEIEGAREDFGSFAAKAMLNGGMGDLQSSDAATKVRAAKDRAELLALQLRALREGFPATEDAVLAARGELAGNIQAQGWAEIEKFLIRHGEIARVYATSVEFGTMLSYAYDIPLRGLDSIKVPDPRYESVQLFSRQVGRLEEDGHWAYGPAWTALPEAVAVFDSTAELRSLRFQLETEAAAIRERRVVGERAQTKAVLENQDREARETYGSLSISHGENFGPDGAQL
jgi:hypothetical protein